jgi:prepilin-type processing-associated H-X9-DG protein
MNGFQDYYTLAGNPSPKAPPSPITVKETDIRHPSDTILFGEKQSASLQYYVILDTDANKYLPDLEEGRHGGNEGLINKSGYANYAFADTSVQLLRYGTSLCPLNLWAITEAGRTNYAVCQPH